MLRARSRWAALLVLASGCIPDELVATRGAGGDVTTGAGGSATTGAGGSATTDASTTSSSSSSCTQAEDCTAPGFCSEATCEDGACNYMPKPLGTPVGNPFPDDCRQIVCDGEGQAEEMPADETPPQTGNECEVRACVDGEVATLPIDEGEPCGSRDPGACKAYTCTDGLCTLGALPDGTRLPDDDLTDCAVLQCLQGGMAYYVAVDALCDDPTPTNCVVPKCAVDATGGVCYSVDALTGQACTKTNGSAGTCNSVGDCL